MIKGNIIGWKSMSLIRPISLKMGLRSMQILIYTARDRESVTYNRKHPLVDVSLKKRNRRGQKLPQRSTIFWNDMKPKRMKEFIYLGEFWDSTQQGLSYIT